MGFLVTLNCEAILTPQGWTHLFSPPMITNLDQWYGTVQCAYVSALSSAAPPSLGLFVCHSCIPQKPVATHPAWLAPTLTHDGVGRPVSVEFQSATQDN